MRTSDPISGIVDGLSCDFTLQQALGLGESEGGRAICFISVVAAWTLRRSEEGSGSFNCVFENAYVFANHATGPGE